MSPDGRPVAMEEDDEDDCVVFKRKPLRFVACVLLDRPLLKSGLGDQMVCRLGLLRFMEIPLPEMDEKLCADFLRTCSRKARLGKASGMVNGHRINLCSHSLRKVTGLPLGELRNGSVSTPESVPILREMFPCMKRSKVESGYYLPRLSRRVDNTEEFMALAQALNEKLMCSDPQLNNVSEVILLALHLSLQDGKVWPWAGLMAKEIVDAVQASKQRRSPFPFGNWLSEVIRSQLPPPDAMSVAASSGKEKPKPKPKPLPGEELTPTKGMEKKCEFNAEDTIPSHLEFSKLEEVISGLVASGDTPNTSGRGTSKLSGRGTSKVSSGGEGSRSSRRQLFQPSKVCGRETIETVKGEAQVEKAAETERPASTVSAGMVETAKVSRHAERGAVERIIRQVAGVGSSDGRPAPGEAEAVESSIRQLGPAAEAPEGVTPVSGDAVETSKLPLREAVENSIHQVAGHESMDAEKVAEGGRPVSGEAVETSKLSGPAERETSSLKAPGRGSMDTGKPRAEDERPTSKVSEEAVETTLKVSADTVREAVEASTDSRDGGVKSSKASATTVKAEDSKMTKAAPELSLAAEEPEKLVNAHAESGRKDDSMEVETDQAEEHIKMAEKKEEKGDVAAEVTKATMKPASPLQVTPKGALLARQLRHLREELAIEKRRRVLANLEHAQMLAELEKLLRRLMQRKSEEQNAVDPVLEELNATHAKLVAADKELYREKEELCEKARLLAEFLSAYDDLKLTPKRWLGRTMEQYVEYKVKIEQLKAKA